jgi:hypothetical protein
MNPEFEQWLREQRYRFTRLPLNPISIFNWRIKEEGIWRWDEIIYESFKYDKFLP